jgi:fatty-acyl-CoA synthase
VSVHDYEELLAAESDSFDWPEVDERSAAAMCYTSGTTGHPKGIVYSHRSSYLHSMGACLGNAFGLTDHDRVMPVVPMFHANAWGLIYASLMSGAALILPDQYLQPPALVKLIAGEKVTVAGGVPTIWAGVLTHMRDEGGDLSSLRLVIAGGSAVPHAMQYRFQEELGVHVLQAWGMTETSPLASVATPPPGVSDEEAWSYRDSQGRVFCAVEGRLGGDEGAILPSDGEAVGEIEVRGPWITGSYYQDDDASKFHDGWLRTGDVGTMDEHGYIRLSDRAKDVIKSGGEWISSMELENVLMAHPDVAEAAVIGVADDKWGERPLAAVVLRSGADVTADKLRAFMAEQIPRWQLPERWCFVDEVPKTSVGKFSKRTMRDAFQRGDYEVIEVH